MPTQLTMTPSTELDAVNMMLMSIGQAPVNTLEVSGIRDVSIAQMHLHNASREVQDRGWHFNTDRKVKLSPDVNGDVAIPSDALSVDASDPSYDIVVRGGLLWDREENSTEFTEAVECDIVRFLPYEDLPQHARTYIAMRAARVFQAGIIGSNILFQFTELHEREAYAQMVRRENRNQDLNMFRAGTVSNANLFKYRRR